MLSLSNDSHLLRHSQAKRKSTKDLQSTSSSRSVQDWQNPISRSLSCLLTLHVSITFTLVTRSKQVNRETATTKWNEQLSSFGDKQSDCKSLGAIARSTFETFIQTWLNIMKDQNQNILGYTAQPDKNNPDQRRPPALDSRDFFFLTTVFSQSICTIVSTYKHRVPQLLMARSER